MLGIHFHLGKTNRHHRTISDDDLYFMVIKNVQFLSLGQFLSNYKG